MTLFCRPPGVFPQQITTKRLKAKKLPTTECFVQNMAPERPVLPSNNRNTFFQRTESADSSQDRRSFVP